MLDREKKVTEEIETTLERRVREAPGRFDQCFLIGCAMGEERQIRNALWRPHVKEEALKLADRIGAVVARATEIPESAKCGCPDPTCPY